MLVCHCLRVSDREVRAAVRCGAADAEGVGARCGAGTGCGGCRPLVEALVRSELRRSPAYEGGSALGAEAAPA